MRKIYLFTLSASFIITTIGCSSTKQVILEDAVPPATVLNAAIDSACYAVGVNYGAGLRENMRTFPGGDANLDALAEGFIAVFKQDTTGLIMSPDAAQAYIQSYIMDIQARESEAAKAAGEAFLEENKLKAGVITTESGLQYLIVEEGSGKKATPEDQVKVHYTGRLLDGTVFDSSVQRGEPATFGVTQVIRGWTEILQIMPEGSKYIIWVPSELGYGTQGAGQMIKPNSVLEFEIELLEVIKQD